MTNRREFMQLSGAAVVAASAPGWAQDVASMPTRAIPGTNEQMAVIGLGNSAAFRSGDREVSTRLLELFLSRGGNYVDVGGQSAGFVGQLGQDMGKSDQLFLANYLDPDDAPDSHEEAARLAGLQGKETLDLIHTRDLAGFRSRHGAYQALKDEGLVRFIGIARTGAANLDAIARLINDGMVDFIQINYSMMEPEAGERLLPLAQDKGIGVAISRPFLNGRYFPLVSGRELPEWATEFDCSSWAQFSLKYILAHPAVNCVLTETANAEHALDNLGAAYGRLPDEFMIARM